MDIVVLLANRWVLNHKVAGNLIIIILTYIDIIDFRRFLTDLLSNLSISIIFSLTLCLWY